MSKSKRRYTLVGEEAIKVQEQIPNALWHPDQPGGDPVKLGDFGQRLKISGVLFQGEGYELLVLGPNANGSNFIRGHQSGFPDYPIQPDLELWCKIIQQTDDPVIFEQDESGMTKAIQRKMQYQISSGVQWAIWDRDGFRCMFCGLHGGTGVPLTVDHFVPLEKGGANDPGNYLSSCRRCQKSKGSRDPKEWCDENKLDYEGLVLYLNGKAPASFIAHLG